MFTLRIWVFKSGVLKKLFILSKHGTKTNIRSTKMANNRHAYNRDVFQRYWTSDGLPLYCSQPTGDKTHTNQQCERLAKIRQITSKIWFNPPFLYQVRVVTVFTVFRLLTDFVCLYIYEFWLSLCKIARSSLILLLPLFYLSSKIALTG